MLEERPSLPEALSNGRGSMAVVTQEQHLLEPLICEACWKKHPGGYARGVLLDEGPKAGAVWLLWVLPDGWSMSDESTKHCIAVCPDDQSDNLIKTLRFS